jgi:hypothetical protein
MRKVKESIVDAPIWILKGLLKPRFPQQMFKKVSMRYRFVTLNNSEATIKMMTTGTRRAFRFELT